MIAIVGKTCVGKTFLLNKAKDLRYSTFNCDIFFENQYKFGSKCYELIKNAFGEKYVNGDFVNKEMIKMLISTENGKNSLEKLIYPVLFDHFLENKYDFVEIPILSTKNCDFRKFFSKTLNVLASTERREKNLKFKNVDNYDFEYFDSINMGIYEFNTVDIYMDKLSINTDWKSFFQSHYIKII